MKATKNVGIDISQKDGIPLSGGNEFYWDAGLAEIIMAEAGEFCPNADFQQKDSTAFSTRFHKDNKNGREVCGRSESLENPKVRVPEVDLDKFIAALDRLHAKADGAGVTGENRMLYGISWFRIRC